MISILLSCYKSNIPILQEQIDSILAQTEKDWELLVYNDGAEFVKEVIEEYKEDNKLAKIEYFDEGHKGCSGAFDYLLQKAKGEYICVCDHDDIWELDKLAVQKQYLDEHPDVDCVFGWLEWFGAKHKVEKFSISDEDISKELYFWQPIKNPTAMFRKDRFGLMEAPFDKFVDFWYWAKYKDRHYHLIEKVLVKYRRHAEQMTSDKSIIRENSAKVIQKSLFDRFGVEPSLNVCRMLDRYSKDYNEELKQFIGKLCEKGTNNV